MRSVKFAAVLTAVIAAGAFAGPASAATVRVTPQIKGAGTVQQVLSNGSLVGTMCTNDNPDDRVTKTDCPQIVLTNDFVSQVTMYIRSIPQSSPIGHWFFPGYQVGACGIFSASGDCGMTSPLFGAANFSPLIIFDDGVGPTMNGAPSETYSNSAERSASFSLGMNEPGTFQCRFDGGGFVGCSPGQDFSFSEGDHTVDARGTDASGNLGGISASKSFKIVDTAITGGPVGTSGPNVVFNYSTVAGISFDCALDGGVVDCGAATSRSYTGLASGVHTFTVRARNGGFFDHISATRTWTVDATPPDTTITLGPANPTASKTAAIQFTSSETSSYQCSLDGAAETGCTSPLNLSGLGLGTHLVTVRATDAYGNVDATPATFSWTVDYAPPDTKLLKAPGRKTAAKKATFRFSSTEAGSTFQCKLDKGAFKVCKSPATYKKLKKGKHTFQVRAIDALGNIDASPVKKTWRIK